jgi:poly-gamma-glutamate capsule biosynthesis protein CapA/YwtB (metallophosphatase superfamily)
VAPSYLWGAALDQLDRVRPDARVINLETSISRSDAYIPKGINYRMSPENAECLLAAGIDCCVLGNNHVLEVVVQTFGKKCDETLRKASAMLTWREVVAAA